jgi:hypothetical protein
VAAEKVKEQSGQCNHYSPGLLLSREPKQQQADQENFNAQGDGEKEARKNSFEYKHWLCNSADSASATKLSYHSPLLAATF